MKEVLQGVKRFSEEVFPQYKSLFESLAHGQSPDALIISCADSRVDPNLFTQSRPGDLFHQRNAGNIVPPYRDPQGDSEAGVAATVEYAVNVLQVGHIVVCGHSDCGAMKGLLNPASAEKLPAVRQWLRYAQGARRALDRLGDGADDAQRLNALIEENVVLQLENLQTHPAVEANLKESKLQLHGWVYEFVEGSVKAYDKNSGWFEPLHAVYTEANLT